MSALRPPKKGEHEYRLCKSEQVKELFGVYPNQIVDYLTILGDTSDNVPGIARIGEKGAVKLLSQFETLDNVYANIDSINGSLKTKLENARATVLLSKELIKLKDDVFESSCINWESIKTQNADWSKALPLFKKIGSARLSSLVKADFKSKPDSQAESAVQKAEYDEKQVKAEKDHIPDYFPEDKVIGFNLKERVKEAIAKGENAEPFFDISIAAWLLDSNSGRYDIDSLKEKYGIDTDVAENECIKQLYSILSRKLEENNLADVFRNMEMPLVSLLAEMENNGILLQPSKLKEFEKELTEQCKTLENDIYAICGHVFNINSPKQLQEILFVERELPTGKKTSTGFSTDSDVLEKLSDTTEDPLPAMILRYRAINKLLSVYTQPLADLCDSDGRIHTQFIQTGTATGRLSSKNPNLQNIPVRTEEGRKIRMAFCAQPGCVLLSADYSQIELAVLAHLSQDRQLCDSFIRKEDVHRQTASLIFDVFPEMVTPQQRRIAKTINFGVIYGMSAFRLAGDLKISRKDAVKFIERYFEKYSGVASFIEKTKKEALETKCVRTAMGHMRAVNEIVSSNHVIRASGERIAVNTVVQGTAAEIVKLAMLSVHSKIERLNLRTKFLLQVHDEIILEVPLKEVETVTSLVKDCMENAVKLSVPLRVEIENAVSWGQLH